MEYSDIIFMMIVILLSSFLQSAIGSGSSLFAIPLLVTFFLDIKDAVIIMVCLSLLINIIMTIILRKHLKVKYFLLLTISGSLLTVIGLVLFSNFSSNLLTTIIGIVLIVVSTIFIFGFRIVINKPERVFVPVGTLSGILNGMFGIGGPPIVIFFSNLKLEKEVFRANIHFYFLILNIISIIGYIYLDLANIQNNFFSNIPLLVYLIPASLIGILLGSKISKNINQNIFEKVVLIIILLSGISLII